MRSESVETSRDIILQEDRTFSCLTADRSSDVHTDQSQWLKPKLWWSDQSENIEERVNQKSGGEEQMAAGEQTQMKALELLSHQKKVSDHRRLLFCPS